MIRKHCAKNFIAILGSIIITVSSVNAFPAGTYPIAAEAAGKKLTLKTCRTLAVENSDKYDSALDSIESKRAKYESSVKSLKLKKKNLTTFRWSPLLKFSFPKKLTFDQASEFEFKPMSLQYDIDIAVHKAGDVRLSVYQDINNLYVDIYTLQQLIEFNEKRKDSVEKSLQRNRAKLLVGEATQSDIDKLESKLSSINSTLSSDRRNLEANLKKLSTKIGTDVTTGYTFESPYVTAELSRDRLGDLISYSLEHDESYYEACIEEMRARVQLETNYRLMRQKYGGDMNRISSYVNFALQGNKVNKKAFKADYKSFLDKIDSYWNGKKRIFLFIKIPRLWLKGDMDGTRYIEDDPNVLYQDVLDYVTARSEKESVERDVTEAVTDAFNTYINVKVQYQQFRKDLKNAEEDLEADEIRNRMGQLTFEEYETELSGYEDLQKSLIDTMKQYSDSLYELDRTTCGGVDSILRSDSGTTGRSFSAGESQAPEESYAVPETASGAYYYMKPIIQKQEFEVSIYIPDDFSVNVTDYELWVNNIQIGERTPGSKKLRHLALTFDDSPEVKIRLYNNDEFVDDCIIDPAEVSGPLTITTGYGIEKNEGDYLGSFEAVPDNSTGLMEIKISPDDPEVKYFIIRDGQGIALGSEEPVAVGTAFKYLQLIADNMDILTIDLMDENKNVISKGRFDTNNNRLVRTVTE